MAASLVNDCDENATLPADLKYGAMVMMLNVVNSSFEEMFFEAFKGIKSYDYSLNECKSTDPLAYYKYKLVFMSVFKQFNENIMILSLRYI